MWHFRSSLPDVAYCGAKCGAQSCIARHEAVECQRCLVKMYNMTLQCGHPDCDWKGPLWQTWIVPGKKRACPRCKEMSTHERPCCHIVVDEFGMQVAMPRAPFVIQEALDAATVKERTD